tara:strand:- start:194809 stop:197514 length:2706 start_codon:yes stop_codon:yes gene_type:complete
LDVLLVALAGLVLYVVTTQLKFDDPRWMHNAWTYVLAVPLIAFVLAILLHGFASRYVQKSVQLGFLFSVFVHLLLMMLAINIVIFSRYFPDATAGVKRERSPLRKTVPEYLFRTPEEKADTPDWSKPTDASTASRVIPQQQRQLPPLDQAAPKLQMPREPQRQPVPLQKFLMRRDQPSMSLPKPADSPGKLARRPMHDENPAATQTPTIDVPDMPKSSPDSSSASPQQVERVMQASTFPAKSNQRDRTADLASVAPRDLSESFQRATTAAPAARVQRFADGPQPQIGESGLARNRTQPTRSRRPSPAGASIAPPAVSMAQETPSSDRVLAPTPTPASRRSRSVGAQLSADDPARQSGMASPNSRPADAGAVKIGRAELQAGIPDVDAGHSSGVVGRSGRRGSQSGFAPAGAPQVSDGLAAGRMIEGETTEDVADRRDFGSGISRRSSATRGATAASNLAMPESDPTLGLGPSLDLPVAEGPAGLANRVAASSGVVPSIEVPQIAALDLSRDGRPRREVGGPTNPVGAKVASVESFSRRVMRTDRGAAPTPAGMVGPATEEAIERGLAYLASTQRADGSWSLADHGEDVLLNSRCAATGLCMLAFQGAGYTHLKHQYADTVSRGLSYLITHQRSNGDLYVRENAMSDRNVALYSHGIASLALCEAYGMTQDPELREPAEQAIRYIALSQHPDRGGWRYTPGISSDTSVTGWMMMALKSGELSGLEVPQKTYDGIDIWLDLAKESDQRPDRYRYNPFAPDTPSQRHGRYPTPTMTAVGMLMRMYSGWRRDNKAMRSAAEYLLRYPPQVGTRRSPQRDTYYWYYATQVMFHMGGKYWDQWNQSLNPVLLESQIQEGPESGSWDPNRPVPDRWSPHAGRLYVTTMNLLNLEVYYRHLPIYEDAAE